MNLISSEEKLDFDDVLVVPEQSLFSSRSQVNLNIVYKFLHSGEKFSGIPIIATNMTTVGNIGTANVFTQYGMMTWLHKFYTIEELSKNVMNSEYVAVTVGLTDDVEPFVNLGVKYINVDVANGYMLAYMRRISEIREKYPKLVIISGCVCTPEGTLDLLKSGADIVRVGIGTGGNCITRVKAGVGYPQISAIHECSYIAKKFGGHIVSDGGCRTPGDVAKAFVAGANFVSLGTILGAHEENTDEWYDKDGNPWVDPIISGDRFAKVYGMSSRTAMEKYYGKVDEYRTSEGKTSLLKYRGSLKDTIQDVLGGLRSACTYTNSHLDSISNAKMVKVNRTHNTYFDNSKIGE